MFVFVFLKDIQRVVQLVQESRLLQQNEKMYVECIYIVCNRRRRVFFFYKAMPSSCKQPKNAHMICTFFLHTYIASVAELLEALALVGEIKVQALERLLLSAVEIKALVAHLRSVLEEGEKLFKD